MPYIGTHSRSRSSSTTPPATTTTTTTMTTNELKNANSAGLALSGVPRRRLHLAFGGFGQSPAPVPSTEAALAASTSSLPTPDSSAHTSPSPSPPDLSRTSSPARRPTFNIGSPKDDRRSSSPPSSSSARRSSGSSGSSSESEEEDIMVRFQMPTRGREGQRDSGFFDSKDVEDGSKDEEEKPVVVTPMKKPTMTLDLSAITAQDRVPFPKDDVDSPSGVPFPAVSGPPSPNVLPRTPSTPIILSNGKPLKSSLKSSASSPNLPPLHLRSRSAPTTPGNLALSAAGTPKSVHFPTRNEELQHVRMYRPAGRPQAVSLDRNAEDTETETEVETSGYPFPVTPPAVAPVQDSIITLHTGLTSPVPTPSSTHGGSAAGNTGMYANVHLETLQLPKTRPYTLVGSVLVRNVAYNKTVAIRFTMDDWQTTSEVTAHYVSSLPSLPPPFHESRSSPLVGDAITSLSHSGVGWDRFGWQVKLEDVTERRLAEKTMYLVARYTAHGEGGGEWWDNNAGANYRVVFKKEPFVPSRNSAGPQSPTTSSTTRQLANQIRADNRSGGLPPLQLKARRPGLSTSLSFGSAPRSVGGGARPTPAMDFGEQNGGVTTSASAPSLSEKDKKGPSSPVSPIRGLSLKNYCPPSTSPKSPPPITTVGLPVTQQPSPPRSPVRTTGPMLELTTREIVLDGGQPITVPVPLGASGSTLASNYNGGRSGSPVHTPSLSASSSTSSTSSLITVTGGSRVNAPPASIALPARSHVDFSRGAFGGSEDNSPAGTPGPSAVLFPASPIGTPSTNASYEALVKQWCFGGSVGASGPPSGYGGPAGGFADQSQHAASSHSFGPVGSASSSFGYTPGERAGVGFMSFTGLGHGKSASEPEWFRGVGGQGRLVAGEMA